MPEATETFEFAGMQATFSRVKVHPGLVIDEVRLSSPYASFAREPFSMSLPQPAQIEADILQRDVQAFLTAMAPGGLRGFNVRMDEGKVFVDATMQILVTVPVAGVGSLRIDQGTKLVIDLESISVGGGAAKNMVQKQLDAINPVFDLSKFPIDGCLTSVDIANGKATIKGHFSLKADVPTANGK